MRAHFQHTAAPKSWLSRFLARLALFLAAASACAAASALDGPTAAKIRAAGTIVIAHRESVIPFAYFDADHRPVGYAIDLCGKVVESLRRELGMPNLRVRYIPIKSEDRIPVITSGRADMECGSTTNTATRRKVVNFTVVHFIAAGKILVRTDGGISSVSQVLLDPSKKLAANTGSTYLSRLQAQQKNGIVKVALVPSTDVDDAFGKLQRHEVDGVLHDDVVLYALRASSSNPEGFKLLDTPLSAEVLGIVMPLDPAFKKFVDMTLTHLMIDGEAQKIYAKWFQQPIPPNDVNLKFPPSYVLLDQFSYPTDHPGDDAPENLEAKPAPAHVAPAPRAGAPGGAPIATAASASH